MAKKWMIAVFAGILLLPNLCFPLVKGFLPDKNLENRVLAAWPAFSPDSVKQYPGQIEAYINDHAPFRNELLNFYSAANLKLFGSIDSKDVIKGKDGWLFYTANDSVEDYRRVNLFSEADLKLILNKLLTVRELYTKEGRNFIFLICPNKEIVYSQYMPDYYTRLGEQSKAEQLVSYLRENSDLNVLYPLEMLKAESEKRLMYYKTDTHWNLVSGFLASQKLIEAAGGAGIALEEMQVKYRPGLPGDLGNIFHLPASLCEDYEAEVAGYLENVSLAYPVNSKPSLVVTESKNAPDPRSVLMIRDSFTDAILPFLSRYFGSAKYVDIQTFSPEETRDGKPDIFIYETVERNLSRLPADLDAMLEQ